MRIGKLLVCLLIAAQLATACKPAGEAATETPGAGAPTANSTQASEAVTEKTTVTVLDAEGNEEEFAPPAPDGIETMLAHVEAGDYTLAEAVLAGLKIYAGEESGLDLFGEEEVQPIGGWRLSALAAQALSAANPATRADLQRVLNKIFPSADVLEAISAPADEVGQAPAAKAASLARQTECTTLWEEGFSSETRSLCLLYIEFTERGHTYRVYYPEERRGDSAFLAYAEAAAQALRDSLRVYGALTEMRDINVLFSALVPESEEGEDVAAFVPDLYPSEIRSGACPVLVLPTGLGDGPADDTFKQLVAHEIFHCVEYWRQGRSTDAAANWYIEGIAEYFSGVVYPNANNEHQYLSGFNYYTMIESIVDLEYSSWVFFQYLGNQFSKEFVLGLLDSLPTTGGRNDQINALSGIGDMATIFHEFGQDFLEQQLRDENGSILPMSPLFLPRNRFALTPSPDRNFETTAFLLSRYLVRYEEAKQYQITLNESGEGLFSVHNREGGEWGDLPVEIASPCGGMVLVGLITTSNAGGEFRNRAHTEWLEEYACDRCLIGTWMQDTDTIENNLRITMGSGIDLVGVSGVFILDIAESGGLLFYPEDYAIQFRTGDDEIAEMRMEGFNSGSYVIPEENVIRSYEGETAFELTLVTPSGSASLPVTPETAPGGPFASGGEFPYECTDTTLTVFIPEGVAPFPTSVYTRISE